MYKYLKKEHAVDLLENNGICIGTLYGYKRMENNKGRSDEFEGMYIDTIEIEHLHADEYFENETIRKNLEGMIEILPDDPNNHSKGNTGSMKNLTIARPRESYNCLIFCISYEKSRTVMEQFEGAEVCVEIHKPDTFFNLITWELKKSFGPSLDFLGIFQIEYDYLYKKRDLYSTPLPPFITKTLDFAPQKELRAVWALDDESLIDKPFYLHKILGLKKCCRVVEI